MTREAYAKCWNTHNKLLEELTPKGLVDGVSTTSVGMYHQRRV